MQLSDEFEVCSFCGEILSLVFFSDYSKKHFDKTICTACVEDISNLIKTDLIDELNAEMASVLKDF
jgi:hypothetical protein